MKLQGRKNTKVWTHFIIGLVIEVADAYDTQQPLQAQLLFCRQRKHTVAIEQCALTCSVRAYLKLRDLGKKSTHKLRELHVGC